MTGMEHPPLKGVRVLEFAGLAPGPFAGMLLADFGASVLRIDRAQPSTHSSTPPPPTPDGLVRHKSSIAVDMKSAAGIALLKALIPHVDVVIDPYRPGVLEKLGLSPSELLRINPGVIVARMTGFRRDGKYKDMAGHDINYIAVSGALSMFGRKHEKPYAPGNVLGDFGGGGAMCFMGILLALISRQTTRKGQVVEANMVDGAAYLATFLRLATKTPMWNEARGDNILDGGCPWYDTYATNDGKYMSVGCLEPQFFAAFLKGMGLKPDDLPGPREDRKTWPKLKEIFESIFKTKSRKEWEAVFDGTDACVAPVLSHEDLEQAGYDQRPPVALSASPGLAIAPGKADRPYVEGQGTGVDGGSWIAKPLRPSVGGEEVLVRWVGWQKGRDFEVQKGGLSLVQTGSKARL